MRSKSIVFILVIALVLAVVATGMVTAYIKKTADRAGEGPHLVPVVVSANDLSFGHTLEEGDLKISMFPEESVPKGAISSVDSLIGQTNKVFLAQNEPILATKLSAIGGGLSLMISPPLRGLSIKVDKVSGVSGFVLPGDRVDVIALIQTGNSRDALAKTILQNVEVLAAGEKTEKQGNEPVTAQSVTLLVDNEGAEKLALAQTEGKLQLSLRNPNDTEILSETDALTKKELLEGPKKEEPKPKVIYRYRDRPKEPEPEPAKPDTLTIIRGRDASKEKPAMDRPEPGDSTNQPPGD